mgnify:CR=1 FL=1
MREAVRAAGFRALLVLETAMIGTFAALDLVLDGRVKLAPFVETHPLDEINHVFHAVHAREITRRAVMVP